MEIFGFRKESSFGEEGFKIDGIVWKLSSISSKISSVL